MKFPSAQTHRAAERVPVWWIGGTVSMRGNQVIIRKAWPWTIMRNVLGERACAL